MDPKAWIGIGVGVILASIIIIAVIQGAIAGIRRGGGAPSIAWRIGQVVMTIVLIAGIVIGGYGVYLLATDEACPIEELIRDLPDALEDEAPSSREIASFSAEECNDEIDRLEELVAGYIPGDTDVSTDVTPEAEESSADLATAEALYRLTADLATRTAEEAARPAPTAIPTVAASAPTAVPTMVNVPQGAEYGTYKTSAVKDPNEWSNWPSFVVPEDRMAFLRAVETRGDVDSDAVGVWIVHQPGETFSYQARDGAYTMAPAEQMQSTFCAVWRNDVLGPTKAAHGIVDTPWGSNPEAFCEAA